MSYTTKELAQHCYTIPVCNTHHVDRTLLLTHLAALIKRAEFDRRKRSEPKQMTREAADWRLSRSMLVKSNCKPLLTNTHDYFRTFR